MLLFTVLLGMGSAMQFHPETKLAAKADPAEAHISAETARELHKMGVKTHAGESIFEAKAAFKRAQEKLKRRLVAAPAEADPAEADPAEAELAAKEDDDDEHEDHDEDEHDKDEAGEE